MNNKPTIILGASSNPERYSFLATARLLEHGHTVWPVGIKKGEIQGIPIQNDAGIIEGVDTITLYLNPSNQESWKEYILATQPKRVIFNPGTENPEFEMQLREKGIEATEACTLVLLGTGQY